MARPLVFPDPNTRSYNDPSIIVSSANVLAFYKKSTGETMEKVTEKVRDEFIRTSLERGWDEATFSGSQCVLKADIPKKEGKNPAKD